VGVGFGVGDGAGPELPHAIINASIAAGARYPHVAFFATLMLSPPKPAFGYL